MSQLDRQRARERALNAREQLAHLIQVAGWNEGHRVKMRGALEQLWREADVAMGGAECRP